jgi:hypothetical protein
MFMVLSLSAAATGVVTWGFWVETALANVRSQAANFKNDPLLYAQEKRTSWTGNAVYLTFKPVSIGLYESLLPHATNPNSGHA